MAKTKKQQKNTPATSKMVAAITRGLKAGGISRADRGKDYREVNSRTSARGAMNHMRQPQLGTAALRYAAALTHPFSKEAEGVRVPEPYAIATVTRKVHTPIVLTSNASGGLDFAVQPHLVSSFQQTLGTMGGGGSPQVLANAPAGITFRSAIAQGPLGAIFQTYRIVSVGVRIKTNIDFTKSSGRVYGAILPASQELPATFGSGITLLNALNCFEIPNDGTSITTNIINLPRAFQFTVSELMSEGGAEIHFPICSARALDFLDAQSQQGEQHLTFTNGVGVESATVGLGQFSAAGHSQFVLRAEGLVPSTDVFTVEVIYHVEGIPLIGSNTLVEAMPYTAPPSTPNELHMAHRMASALPVVAYVSEKLKGRGMNRAASFAGAAHRVLGLAVRGMM